VNPPGGQPIEVAAGLVFRDGRLLIARRPLQTHLGGLWEFPGGKREPGETYEECLRRELAEELGIEVRVLELVEALTHDYPDRSVHLQFFRCRWLRHEPKGTSGQDLAWITAEDLSHYQFPAADARLLERLRRDWRNLITLSAYPV
jgi:8-oxo-dGTP diphosphatase